MFIGSEETAIKVFLEDLKISVETAINQYWCHGLQIVAPLYLVIVGKIY